MGGNGERVLGPFLIERELGRGGMGVVLLGRHRALERPAVLKKLPRDFAAQPELAERFQREARAAAAVHHQNVVAVYDCFSFRNEHYIAQEYVDGVDLRAVLASARRVPARVAALIALEIARGLDEIHSHGTVHRDLKPGNVLLGRRGEVKIGDFGIALEATGSALTQPGVALGTPPYMPPEQLLGDRVDGRGDVYAFGVVLYEMLIGEPPFAFGGEGVDTLLGQMQRERYTPPRRRTRDCPRALGRLVRGCLRARPRQRLAGATELRRRLEHHLGRPSPADCREEIAAWLWQAGVFERRSDETARAATAPRPASRLRRAWRGAGVALAATLALWGLWLLRPDPADAIGAALRQIPGWLRTAF